MSSRARELDGVEFRTAVDGWPAGTRAVVVSESPESALVEVSTEHLVDAEGLPLRSLFDDLVYVRYDDLRVVSPLASGMS